MSPKNDPRSIWTLLQGDGQDFDIQAGPLGMTASQAAARYLKSPGHYLALLRFFRRVSVEDIAAGTGIPKTTLAAYEKGDRSPSLKDLTAIASYYSADLRVLLEVFGHVNPNAAESSMGIAAQFSGALTEEEKLSLKELVKYHSERVKGGSERTKARAKTKPTKGK